MTIYLDNAASTPIHPQVIEAMMPYITNYYGNPSSIHAIGRQARAAIEKSRKTIAHYLNASISEIFFTSGGTESNNMALIGAVNNLGIKKIITSPLEHHCVLHTVEFLEKQGVTTEYLNIQPNGHLDLNELELKLQQSQVPTMVSLMHANNEIGNLLNLEAVSNLCKEYKALFHSDTVQTFAHYTLDVQKNTLNFLTGTAHKFHGPKGVGFIYINNNNKINPLIYGGSQERNLRAGTENVAGIVGLGEAAKIMYDNLGDDSIYIASIKRYAIDKLTANIPGINFNGDISNNSLYTVLNVSFPQNSHTELLLMHLDIAGICASGGSACSSGVDAGSHVLNKLPIDKNRTNIRFSFSKFNTLKEVDELILKLKEILKIKA